MPTRRYHDEKPSFWEKYEPYAWLILVMVIVIMALMAASSIITATPVECWHGMYIGTDHACTGHHK